MRTYFIQQELIMRSSQTSEILSYLAPTPSPVPVIYTKSTSREKTKFRSICEELRDHGFQMDERLESDSGQESKLKATLKMLATSWGTNQDTAHSKPIA